MIISQRWHKARKEYRCEEYRSQDCKRLIYPGERYMRSYGSSGNGEHPYELLHCEPCGRVIEEWQRKEAESKRGA